MYTEIRLGEKEDLEDFARIHVESWLSTYGGEREGMLENRMERWRRVLVEGQEQNYLLVAEGRAAGFLSIKDNGNGEGEVGGIYILEEDWRKGFGKQLLGFAAALARNKDWESLSLWVLRENLRAKAFYISQGYLFTGEEKQTRFKEAVVVEERFLLKV